MIPVRADYQAYLLRLWRGPQACWRASLEDAHNGERLVFATLAQLVAFLEQQTKGPGAGGPAAVTDEVHWSAAWGFDAPDELLVDGES